MELFEATNLRNIEQVTLLIERGADVNVKDVFGLTPLHHAVANRYSEIVVLLLKGGANVDAQTNEGLTPLYYAAWRGPVEIVKLLLESGANTERTSENDKPRNWAINEEIDSIFEEYESFTDIKEPGCE